MRKILVVLVGLLPLSAYADIFAYAGGAVLRIVTSPQATVPNVVGLSTAAADTALETEGLDTGTINTRCSTLAVNTVLFQSPTAGSSVNTGTLVNLVASDGISCRIRGPQKPRFNLF